MQYSARCVPVHRKVIYDDRSVVIIPRQLSVNNNDVGLYSYVKLDITGTARRISPLTLL